jgi:hypothetical protein
MDWSTDNPAIKPIVKREFEYPDGQVTGDRFKPIGVVAKGASRRQRSQRSIPSVPTAKRRQL